MLKYVKYRMEMSSLLLVSPQFKTINKNENMNVKSRSLSKQYVNYKKSFSSEPLAIVNKSNENYSGSHRASKGILLFSQKT